MTLDPCTMGFREFVHFNLLKPVEPQLRRRRLVHRTGRDLGNPEEIKKIIEHNSSLRVEFGWSFESSYHYNKIMDGVIKDIIPRYHAHAGLMTTDTTCSWIGFIQHNSYDKEIYKDMSVPELIDFNNEIIDFQVSVIESMSNHTIFKQHSLMRDEYYRFSYFKNLRKDRGALAVAYHQYMDALHETCLITSIMRDTVEEQIGCHYLTCPDLFFELLEFSILKGEIYG